MANPTIKDVAEKAGVSISTVSRALNNNYPVSEEVRERINQAVSDLGYKANLLARSLKTQKSDMIGLVVADMSNNFFMQAAKGIEQAVMPHGFNLLIAGSDSDPEKEAKLLSMLLERRVAALVVATCDRDSTAMQPFAQAGIPVILLDRTLNNFETDYVVEKNVDIAYRLTKHLLEKGHRHIGIANVLLSNSPGIERYEGFLKAHTEFGLKPSNKLVSKSCYTVEEAQSWARRVFTAEDRPTAVVCCNNIMTEGVLLTLKELNIRVPEEVSVVSFGQLPMQSLLDVKVTSSLQNSFQMGVYAGQIAINRIEEKQQTRAEIVMDAEIVPGNSVAAPCR